mgnify:CR=1 FL=1
MERRGSSFGSVQCVGGHKKGAGHGHGIHPDIVHKGLVSLALALATAQRAAAFLLEKAPKDPNEGLPDAFKKPWTPSKATLADFHQYMLAVTDPADALAKALKGQAVPQTMETFRIVHPEFLKLAQKQAMERLSAQSTALTYKQRLALQPILGPDVFALSPAQMKLLQAVTTPKPVKPSSTGGDGRQVVSQQKNLETQAQRSEAR